MRVHVDRELCAGFGRCVTAAPGVFELNDDGVSRVLVPEPEGPDAEAAVRAASLCPRQAIGIRRGDHAPLDADRRDTTVRSSSGTSPGSQDGSPLTIEPDPTRTLPVDGTPTCPSATFAAWRAECPATPLRFADAHDGIIVTGHDLARAVLGDPTFRMRPSRFPMPGQSRLGDDERSIDARAAADLLAVDGAPHRRFRQVVAKRMSTRHIREARPMIEGVVSRRLADFLAAGSPADLTAGYSEPISAEIHCRTLGVPEDFHDEFCALFLHPASTAERAAYTRTVLARKREEPSDDTFSDLVTAGFSELEAEGVALQLLLSGRDSVAYAISTGTVDLLRHPDQWEILRADPSRAETAVDELLRHGSMFLTLFGRTPVETVTHAGVVFEAGRTVAVSPIGANRDPARFADPDRLDLNRDASGQLAFGYGAHVCVGHHLARAEVGEALRQLVRAVPDLRLVSAEQETPQPFAHPVATYRVGEVVVAWG
jgi:cytochrome P450/ferredoxin